MQTLKALRRPKSKTALKSAAPIFLAALCILALAAILIHVAGGAAFARQTCQGGKGGDCNACHALQKTYEEELDAGTQESHLLLTENHAGPNCLDCHPYTTRGQSASARAAYTAERKGFLGCARESNFYAHLPQPAERGRR